jgi:hypothetical protein
MAGVEAEVQKRRVQSDAVDGAAQGLARRRRHDRDRGRHGLGRETCDSCRDVPAVDRRLERGLLRKGQQASQELCGPLARVQAHLGQAVRLGAGLKDLAERLIGAHDHGQQVVKVVRQHAGLTMQAALLSVSSRRGRRARSRGRGGRKVEGHLAAQSCRVDLENLAREAKSTGARANHPESTT